MKSGALPPQPAQGITQAVLLEILTHGPVDRTAIAERLDRSLARVSRVAATLLSAGLITEDAATRTQSGGRPRVPLAVVADAVHFVGFKITADTLFSVVTDMRGEPVGARTTHLRGRTPASITRLIASNVRAHQKTFPNIVSLGVTLGGQTHDHRTVKRAPFLGWHDIALGDLVERATGLPTWIENDVRALTQAEHWFGDGRGLDSFALLTIGAGIGLGIVANNAVVAGANSTAGSIGHQRIAGSDATCELGHQGCARAILATDFITAEIGRALGRTVQINELPQLAAAADPRVSPIIDLAGIALGQILAGIANVLDPGLILISGEGVGIATAAHATMMAGLQEGKHWITTTPEVITADFDFSEWARGGAAVAIGGFILGPHFDALLNPARTLVPAG